MYKQFFFSNQRNLTEYRWKMEFYQKYYYFTCLLIITVDGKIQINKEHQQQCHLLDRDNCEKYVEADIDYELNGLAQDDPKLVYALKTKYMMKPSDLPYKFSNLPLNYRKLQVR